jgi:cytochrome P450
MVDLFLAGMETTTTSLIIITLHLLHHADVQKKVHEEIDEVNTRRNHKSSKLKETLSKLEIYNF